MDARRKEAYRHLLYYFCLNLRHTAPYGRTPYEAFWNVFRGRRFWMLHHPYLLGDAFHNLADFSKRDFASFDEDRFWNIDMASYERYRSKSGWCFRTIFDEYLKND